MQTIEGTVADVVAGDRVTAESVGTIEVESVTRSTETPSVVSLFLPSGEFAVLWADAEVTIERAEVDEGHECPTCHVRHSTEEGAWDCLIAHDEERAGV